jgi:hypothetical protein
MAALDSSGPPGSPSGAGADLALVSAIEAIEEMGSAAKTAIPNVERVRLVSMAARLAVNRALRSINGPDRPETRPFP